MPFPADPCKRRRNFVCLGSGPHEPGGHASSSRPSAAPSARSPLRGPRWPSMRDAAIRDRRRRQRSRRLRARCAARARASPPSCVVLVHEPRAGVANARNAGLRAARGEFIAFLDDDETRRRNLARRTPARAVRDERRRGLRPGAHTACRRASRSPRLFRSLLRARSGPRRRADPDVLRLRQQPGPPRRAAFGRSRSPPERNEIGGEDDLLFQGMQASGAASPGPPAPWCSKRPSLPA